MAIAPLAIPQAGAFSGGVDFSPLANLGQVYQKAQQDQLRQQTLAQLGQGGTADANALLRSGDLSLAQLGISLRNRQEDLARQGMQDARQATNDKFNQNLQMENLKIDKANLANNSEGPEETAAQRAAAARTHGIDPASPAGKAYILTGKLPEADTFQTAIDQRRSAATVNGLDPSSPGFQSYVLTGKMPREDAQPLTATDKKAILEADEGVLSAKTALSSLDRALKLSEQAFSGPLASKRGYAASFLGSTSDMGKAGIATTQLDNEVTSNALSQLKAIFGGAPTEGERKILLDIQGASSQPHEVRKEIFARARLAAEARLKFNEQRANELRGGQFYKPQGSMSRAPAAQTQGITQAQYEALPSGSTFTAPDGTQRVKP